MQGLEEINQLVRQLKTIQLAEGHLHQLHGQIESSKIAEMRLGRLLNDKYESVESLKSSSVRNLFKTILGSREDEIEMERQEYLQVVLQYHDARKSVELMEYEVKVLENQIAQKAEIEALLENAIREHRAEILQAYPKTASRITEIEADINVLVANQKELEEALEVGNELINLLHDISENLLLASDWGDWDDPFLSRKMEVKAKNRYVDKAMIKVHEAQVLFSKFDKELQDIHEHKKIIGTYHFQDFGAFSKVYYNRLIADWVIQKQIKNTRSNVINVRDSVILIATTLKHEIKQADEEIIILCKQIDDLVRLSIDNF